MMSSDPKPSVHTVLKLSEEIIKETGYEKFVVSRYQVAEDRATKSCTIYSKQESISHGLLQQHVAACIAERMILAHFIEFFCIEIDLRESLEVLFSISSFLFM